MNLTIENNTSFENSTLILGGNEYPLKKVKIFSPMFPIILKWELIYMMKTNLQA